MATEYIHASSKPARLGRKGSPGAGTLPSTRGAVITPLIGISSPAARQRKMPISLAGLDEDAILARIENGESIAAIAASLGVDRSTLSKWLNAAEHRSARARGPASGSSSLRRAGRTGTARRHRPLPARQGP
jgi:hypothetical protein